MTNPTQVKAALVVWWLIWAATLSSLIVLYVFLGRAPRVDPSVNLITDLAGLVPLFVSIIIRWLVLPRAQNVGLMFVLFLAGLFLAEAGGIISLFIGRAYHGQLFVISILAVVQFIPVFVRRQLEPKGSGFIPNN